MNLFPLQQSFKI